MDPVLVHSVVLPGTEVCLANGAHYTSMLHMMRFHMICHILPLLANVFTFTALEASVNLVVQASNHGV
jgi:hypothetical protein